MDAYGQRWDCALASGMATTTLHLLSQMVRLSISSLRTGHCHRQRCSMSSSFLRVARPATDHETAAVVGMSRSGCGIGPISSEPRNETQQATGRLWHRDSRGLRRQQDACRVSAVTGRRIAGPEGTAAGTRLPNSQRASHGFSPKSVPAACNGNAATRSSCCQPAEQIEASGP